MRNKALPERPSTQDPLEQLVLTPDGRQITQRRYNQEQDPNQFDPRKLESLLASPIASGVYGATGSDVATGLTAGLEQALYGGGLAGAGEFRPPPPRVAPRSFLMQKPTPRAKVGEVQPSNVTSLPPLTEPTPWYAEGLISDWREKHPSAPPDNVVNANPRFLKKVERDENLKADAIRKEMEQDLDRAGITPAEHPDRGARVRVHGDASLYENIRALPTDFYSELQPSDIDNAWAREIRRKEEALGVQDGYSIDSYARGHAAQVRNRLRSTPESRGIPTDDSRPDLGPPGPDATVRSMAEKGGQSWLHDQLRRMPSPADRLDEVGDFLHTQTGRGNRGGEPPPGPSRTLSDMEADTASAKEAGDKRQAGRTPEQNAAIDSIDPLVHPLYRQIWKRLHDLEQGVEPSPENKNPTR